MQRQIGAIKAVREVNIEHLLTELRLLRSCFSEEQLKKPVFEVFEETMPNLSIVKNKESNKFEVVWKDKESMNMNCGGDVHASLLQRLSMVYPHCSSSIPPLGGAFEYSSNAGQKIQNSASLCYLCNFFFQISFYYVPNEINIVFYAN